MSLLTNLVSYWKLDETSGTRFDSNSTHDLTDNNTVSSATGKINTAASFAAASSESLTVASASWMNVAGQDFSVSLWCNPTTTPDYACIFSRSGTNFEVRLAFGGATFEFNLADSTVLTAGSVSAATWYHIVASRSVSLGRIYLQVNNGTQANAAYSVDASDAGNALAIGARPNASLFWNGLIDEVGFWTGRMLAAQDVTDLYNGGAGLPYSSFGGAAAGPVARPVVARQAIRRAAFY